MEKIGNDKIIHSLIFRIGEYVRMAGGLELIDKLMESDLAKSKIAKQGLEDMKLLLRYQVFASCLEPERIHDFVPSSIR